MGEFEEQEKYNFIFNQIVEKKDDFVGSMAYVLYKWNKIEFIEKYKREHNGKDPELAELREWQKGECASLKLGNYKQLAEENTNKFINNLQGKKEQDLTERKASLDKRESSAQLREKQIKAKEDALIKREKKVIADEEKIKIRERKVANIEREVKKRDECCHVKDSLSFKGFIFGVTQSLVASILFVILGYFFVLYMTKDTDILKDLLKNKTEKVSNQSVDSINNKIV